MRRNGLYRQNLHPFLLGCKQLFQLHTLVLVTGESGGIGNRRSALAKPATDRGLWARGVSSASETAGTRMAKASVFPPDSCLGRLLPRLQDHPVGNIAGLRQAEWAQWRTEISNMELSLVYPWPNLPAMGADNIAKVEIRRASREQADEAFWLAEEYFAAIAVVLREDRRRFIEEYFGDGKGFWTARADGQLAGCVALRRLQPSGPPDGQVVACAEIKRMYVREKFRGQGIAQRLLEAAEEFAIAAGYRWIYLDTSNEMLAAAKLYQRNGFARCERYNQNPQAGIFMRKAIG